MANDNTNRAAIDAGEALRDELAREYAERRAAEIEAARARQARIDRASKAPAYPFSSVRKGGKRRIRRNAPYGY
jgi:hypothetical protein